MKEFLEILTVFALSTVKFGFGGVLVAVTAGFSFMKAFTVTVGGGIVGTVIFTNISDFLFRRARKAAEKRRLQTHKPPPKKFTRINKLVIITKKKLGLWGLALLTPSLLSLPVGIILAVRYFKKKQRIMQVMIVSIIVWEIIFYFFWKYLLAMIKQLF